MSPTPGVALAGCGRIAQRFHLPLLAGSPSARLIAVADADDAARDTVLHSSTTRAPAGLRDWRSLLDLPGVDAVVVALPTALHAEVATAAFAAGKHVYVEKPLAHDLGAAAAVVDAWKASGRVGIIGFNFRAHPLARAARDAVRGGQLGTLVGVRMTFASAPRALPEWKQRRLTGGGALLDLASHHIDLLRFILDTEIEAVSATVRSVLTEADTAAATCRLANGAVAQLFVSNSAADQDRIELIGETGTLVWDRVRRRRLEWLPSRHPATPAERLAEAGRQLVEGTRATVDRLRPPAETSFASALEAFLAAVARGTTDGEPTIADGFASLEVIDAAERSSHTGAEVTLSR